MPWTPRLVVEVAEPRRFLQIRITLTSAGAGGPIVTSLEAKHMLSGEIEALYNTAAGWNAGAHAGTQAAGATLALAGGQVAGTWTSPVIDRGADPGALSTAFWAIGALPAGATVTTEARTSTDNATWQAWETSAGPNKPLHSHLTMDAVEGCTVTRKRKGEAGAFRFTVRDTSFTMRPLFQRLRDVIIHQGWQPAGEATDTNKLRRFRGLILRPPRKLGLAWTTYQVEGADYTAMLANFLGARAWQTKRPDEILFDALTAFGPAYIGTGRVQAFDRTTDYTENWTHLLDVVRDLQMFTGWPAWVDEDLELRFEAPSTSASGVELSETAGNLYADSAEFDLVGPTVNDMIVFGGKQRSASDHEQTFLGDGVAKSFTLDYNPSNVRLDINGVPATVAPEGLNDFGTHTALFNYANRILKFETPPAAGALIHVVFGYDYPVTARYKDSESIRQYGPLQARVVNTKLKDKLSAREYARARVRVGARQTWDGSVSVAGAAIAETAGGWPITAGGVVDVILPRDGIDGRFEITEETMESTAANLAIDLRLQEV